MTRRGKGLMLLGILGILILVVFGATYVQAESQETYIKQEYQDYVYEIADDFGICPEIVLALIETESGGNPNAIGSSGDTGLCQIIPKFSKYSKNELLDPYKNIYACCELLSELSMKYEIQDALAAYNMGEYSKKFKRIVGTGQTTEYAEKIMKRAYELEEVHGKHLCN